MGLFTIITDAKAITRVKGSYYQVDLYTRNGRVYLKQGSAYHYLRKNGGTSKPDLLWDELVWNLKEDYDDLGRMVHLPDPASTM